MSAAKSTYLRNALLDHTLRGVTYTPPATLYVALFTTACAAASVGTEVSGGSYARQAVTFAAASNGLTTNSAAVDWGTATANWGAVTHFAVMDASSGGYHLYFGALTTPKTVNSGTAFRFNAGALAISEF